MFSGKTLSLSIILSFFVSGCGLYTPDKNPFVSDAPLPPDGKFSDAGSYENGLVDHITCEISKAVYETDREFHLPWLRDDWGTAVTLSMTVEDQSGLNPGLSLIILWGMCYFLSPLAM
jgi:hypothetical protein